MNKKTAIVWKDGEEDRSIEFSASPNGGNEDLDEAARRFGYVDYADMAQEEGWSEDEGLNIKWTE